MRGKKMTFKERQEKLEKDCIYRKQIFKELCEHVASGKSLDCFGPIDDDTIRKYLKNHPLEFVEGELKEAMRKGKDFWENLGVAQSNGSCLGNSRTWYYNMANRFGWRDKLDIEAEHKGSVQVQVVSYSSKKAPRTNESEQST